jgi:hypothetical protein
MKIMMETFIKAMKLIIPKVICHKKDTELV